MGFRFSGVAAIAILVSSVSAEDCVAGPEQGRAIYNFRCYFCHGYSGDARTLAAEMLRARPRDFTRTDVDVLSREHMIDVVANGIPGSAMKPFASLLDEFEIAAVVDFIRTEFMVKGAINTRYHIPENGWPDHQRFSAAFPFVRGEIALSADEQTLTPLLRRGRELYMNSCISCHDSARGLDNAPSWEPEAVSYPRTGFATGDFLNPPDAHTGATPFSRHEIPPELGDPTSDERRGEVLFQTNCAFCHAADGTGRNWIGTFMIPHPRDLTSPDGMREMTRERLDRVIRDGIPGTSMPAWKGVLNEAEIHNIVQYIEKAFYPSLGAR